MFQIAAHIKLKGWLWPFQSSFWLFLQESSPDEHINWTTTRKKTRDRRKQGNPCSGPAADWRGTPVHQQICSASFQPSYPSYLLPLLHLLPLLRLFTPSVVPNSKSTLTCGFNLRMESWKEGLEGREEAHGKVRGWRWGRKTFLRFY